MYKIIVVDDEALALKHVAEILEKSNLNIEVVGEFLNSSDALEYIKNNDVDICMTDINMPLVDGIGIARKCYEKYSSTKIVFITSFTEFEFAKKEIEYGVYRYLFKPLTKDKIIKVISGLIKNEDEKLKYRNSLQSSGLKTDFGHLLSDLFCGVLLDSKELDARLVKIGIPIDIKNKPCALLNLHITDFEMYKKNIWKYSDLRLYNSVSMIVPFETQSVNASTVFYSLSNVGILLIFKEEKCDIKTVISETMENICNDLKSIIKLESKYNIIKLFNSLLDVNNAPLENGPIGGKATYGNIINSAIEFMKANYAKEISLEDISKHINLSLTYFSSCFKKQTGMTVIDYMNTIRIEKAKEFLKNPDIKIASICEMVGYKSLSYFYSIFKNYCNDLSPAQYRGGFLSEEE